MNIKNYWLAEVLYIYTCINFLTDSLTNKIMCKKKLHLYKIPSPTYNFHKNSEPSIQEKQHVYKQNKNVLKIGS